MKCNFSKINFQGGNIKTKKKYFEGWYFKQVSKDRNFTICFIPGVSFNDKDSHAFIQCIFKDENNKHKTYYFKYSLEEFSYTKQPFTVTIGECFFSIDKMKININDNGTIINGNINFTKTKDLKRTFHNPNIMGYFSYIPNLECNHEIISMSHYLSGNISINNVLVDFENGKGYIEKDWGRSFPEKYIWIQSNNFEKENISFCCSIAAVPVFNRVIEGFFCNLVINDKEYRFATYNHSKVNIVKCNEKVFEIVINNRKYNLEINGKMTPGEELVAPKNGSMSYKIKEALKVELCLILKDKNNNIIINTMADNGGIEVVNYIKLKI